MDHLKRQPYTGRSTLQTVSEDPEFKDKLKHAADIQSVFEEIRKRITKTYIENAYLNQLDGPNVGNINDDLTRFEKMKNWWKSISTGDPKYDNYVLMFEYPEFADTP